MRLPAIGLCLLTAVAVTSCGAGGDTPVEAQPTPKVTVVIKDKAYHPPTVTIKPGSRVTWVNRDENGVTVETLGVGFFEFDRTKLDDQNLFDLHTLQQSEAESVEFDAPGTYHYHSSYDPTMRGVVEVTEEDSDG